MDDEMLIEKVRRYDEIYNKTHKKYSDNQHKDLIWANIGKEMNTTGQLCKNRWISLRDQLRKALKKQKTKNGRAADIQTKWKYEDCMSFVIPFFKKREKYSNIASPKSASEDSNNEDTHHNNKTIDNHVSNEDIESEEEIAIKCSKFMGSLSRKTNSPKNILPPNCYKAKKKIKLETASSLLMQYLLDNENNRSKETTSCTHPIDTFFSGLAATVKTFSPEYQHMAKNKLFAIVSELEWAQLQNKTTNNQISESVGPSTLYFYSNSSSSSVPGN